MTNPDHIHELAHGLRLVHRHMPDTDSVTIQFFFGAGGRYEDFTREYGVSHFLEHLLFQGSQKYPSSKVISETVDSVGGYMNAYTTAELTSYYAKVPSEHFETLTDLLVDMTLKPLFDPKQIERERGVIIEEMNVYRDDPGQYVFDLVGDLLWPEDSLKTNVIGTEHTIRGLSREVIAGYHASMYGPSNMVVAIAGNVTLEHAREVLERLLSAARVVAEPRKLIPTRGQLTAAPVYIYHRNTNQTHLVLAGRALALRHPHEPALRVLSALLGTGMSSRLFHSVREEKGLAYTIFMGLTSFIDDGKWEVYAGVNNDKLDEALGAIVSELERARSETVSAAELDRVKQQMRGRIIMSQETNGAVADRIGSELLLTGSVRTLDELIEQINAVTADELQMVAQRYLDPTGMRLALIGPHEQSERLSAIIRGNMNS